MILLTQWASGISNHDFTFIQQDGHDFTRKAAVLLSFS